MSAQKGPWSVSWNLLGALGKGGQGLTYKVSHASGSPNVSVLKRLKNNQDAQARRRMYREVANLRVLHNAGGSVPGVIDENVNSYDDPTTVLYLVIEHIPGETLEQVVRSRGPLDFTVAAEIVLAICQTVKHGHSLDVIHRDLKPDNIIVRDFERRDVVIIDYGLSFNDSTHDDGLTELAETFRNKFLDLPENNTPGGNRRDPRSDITAVVGILYFCLTGHVPGHLQSAEGRAPHKRDGFSIKERLSNHASARAVESLFDMGFAVQIASRFQSVDEFVARLKACSNPTAAQRPLDPVEIARAATEKLVASDRKTQLREYSKTAARYEEQIHYYINSRSGKLGNFHLVATGGDMPKFPREYDLVPSNGLMTQVNASHHPFLHRATWRFGARGEQCVLLRFDSWRPEEGMPIVDLADWREIFWFDPRAEVDKEILRLALDDWLGWAIEDIVELISRAPS